MSQNVKVNHYYRRIMRKIVFCKRLRPTVTLSFVWKVKILIIVSFYLCRKLCKNMIWIILMEKTMELTMILTKPAAPYFDKAYQERYQIVTKLTKLWVI